jgi:hypothetical protein
MEKRKWRRAVVIGIALSLVIILFVFTGLHFPKLVSRFPLYFILFAIDLYLWLAIRKRIRQLLYWPRITLSLLYWIPLFLNLVLMSISVILPEPAWNTPVYSLLTGIVLVAYSSKLIAIVFFFIADLARTAAYTFRFIRTKVSGKEMPTRARRMSRARFLEVLGLAGGGLMLSGMTAGMIKWARDFRVRRERIKLPGLPPAFDGMRIVQISDLHLGSWIGNEPMEEAVEIINGLDADLVLFTGDLVNFSTSEAYPFRELLSKVRAREGVYAILGNHDYGDYITWASEEAKEENMHDLFRFFDDIGWQLLQNENRILEREGERIALVGVENWSANSRFRSAGDLDRALAGTEGVPAVILMSHDPSHWEKEVSVHYPKIGLTLSGHTHGFQFGIEVNNFRWSFAQYVYKYWAGLYSVAHGETTQHLYVNRGLGVIGYPGRVGILPEITLIELTC